MRSKIVWCLLVIVFLCGSVQRGLAQVITTVAGTGSIGHTGDGGPATTAKIAGAALGSFDAAGNYYFGEGLSSTGVRIRKVNTLGIISTAAGNGTTGFSGDGTPATSAKIGYTASFVDAIGNIYIADHNYYRIRKVDVATGIIHTIAGNGTNTSTGNGGPATTATLDPIDLCVDGAGNIFFSDQASVTIRRIDAVTGFVKQITTTTAVGMCIDKHGKLFLGGGTRVFKVDTATGVIDTVAGIGIPGYNGDEIPATSAKFAAMDIALDTSGRIFIADYANNRVRMIDLSNVIHTIAGTE